jgi:hypothetical protein
LIVKQVPFESFKSSLGKGPHVKVALTELAIACIILLTDTFSTWIALLSLGVRWSLKRVLGVRGATYLLVMVNYAVGQGGFGYYLYRSGLSALRAFGSTLYVLGTNLAALLVLTFTIWVVAGPRGGAHQEMWWTLVVMIGAFVAYLAVIATRISFLQRREVFAPLFDAGLKGHAVAIAGRMPHISMVVLGFWLPMIVWGIHVPIGVAIVYMPAVALAAALPISPAGLGTTQAAMIYFFADYAPGATSDERTANLLAFGVAHFVYSVAAGCLVGLVCMIAARRAGILDIERPEAP